MKIAGFFAGIAALVFMASLCAIESLRPEVLGAMLISGGYLVAYGVICQELRRSEER